VEGFIPTQDHCHLKTQLRFFPVPVQCPASSSRKLLSLFERVSSFSLVVLAVICIIRLPPHRLFQVSKSVKTLVVEEVQQQRNKIDPSIVNDAE
jgi:hypothetical protein